jgi:hypothetical protein
MLNEELIAKGVALAIHLNGQISGDTPIGAVLIALNVLRGMASDRCPKEFLKDLDAFEEACRRSVGDSMRELKQGLN